MNGADPPGADPTEADGFRYRAESIGRSEPGSPPSRVTFREATGGPATLETGCADRVDGLFACGFETP